jgi:hypothetical protein
MKTDRAVVLACLMACSAPACQEGPAEPAAVSIGQPQLLDESYVIQYETYVFTSSGTVRIPPGAFQVRLVQLLPARGDTVPHDGSHVNITLQWKVAATRVPDPEGVGYKFQGQLCEASGSLMNTSWLGGVSPAAHPGDPEVEYSLDAWWGGAGGPTPPVMPAYCLTFFWNPGQMVWTAEGKPAVVIIPLDWRS